MSKAFLNQCSGYGFCFFKVRKNGKTKIKIVCWWRIATDTMFFPSLQLFWFHLKIQYGLVCFNCLQILRCCKNWAAYVCKSVELSEYWQPFNTHSLWLFEHRPMIRKLMIVCCPDSECLAPHVFILRYIRVPAITLKYWLKEKWWSFDVQKKRRRKIGTWFIVAID